MSRKHVRLLKKAREILVAGKTAYICHAVGYADGGICSPFSKVGKDIVFDIQRRLAIWSLRNKANSGGHVAIWLEGRSESSLAADVILPEYKEKSPDEKLALRLKWIDEELLPYWEKTIKHKPAKETNHG